MNNYSKGALLALLATPLTLKAEQPNIVLIMVDQMTADGLSCMGNRDVETPSIDKMARQGVLFETSYVTQPLSCPCRTSLQTGMYPHENGVMKNGMELVVEPDYFASRVQSVGYNTAYYGKWHVPATIDESGYMEGLDCYDDERTTTLSVEYIKNADSTRPYFLTVSYNNPHNICELARGDELPNGEIEPTPSDPSKLPKLPTNYAIPHDEPSKIREVQKLSAKQYPTIEWGEDQWREYLWGYYRLIEKVDREIGQVLNAIENDAKRETIVIFVSDHGEGVARHRWNQKQVLYDQSVKVPTIISSFESQRVAQAKRSKELVSMSLDVPMTIVDIAGASQSGLYRGESLWYVAQNHKAEIDREYIFAETVFAAGTQDFGLEGRMVRSDRFKYIVYDNGENREQLFDMKRDSGEQNNLVNNPRYGNELVKFREVLAQWQRETNDSSWRVY
ncbi:MAG: sulfatase-like hydrolase/transferase [Rikenellaceae bacterium]